jgi:hypothetical protein
VAGLLINNGHLQPVGQISRVRQLCAVLGNHPHEQLIDYTLSSNIPALSGIDAAIGFPVSSWKKLTNDLEDAAAGLVAVRSPPIFDAKVTR